MYPDRVEKSLQEDVKRFSGIFAEDKEVPVRIAVRFSEKEGDEETREIPPPSQRLALIVEAHRWGHFAVRKSLDRLTLMNRVWWVGMEADVETVISRCEGCLRDGAHRTQFHESLHIPIPSGVFDRVHMDLLSLPLATDGSCELLVFIDALSKFPIAFPLPSKEMEGIAHCLWQVISMFGAPIALHSDNGAEFVNGVVDKMASIHGIERRLITSYRPQANGQVERYNAVIQAILRKCAGDEPGLWPQWIEFVMLAMRTATHVATGRSPFQVMFGRECHPLANYAILNWSALAEEEEGTPAWNLAVRRVLQLHEQLHRTRKMEAFEGAEKASMSQRHTQDVQHASAITTQRLQEDTPVYVRQVHPKHKLEHRFVGPFWVSKEQRDVEASANYRLRDAQGRRLERSLPRDAVFEVQQASVQGTLRQMALHDPLDWGDAVAALRCVEPGPMPKRKGQASEERWAVEYIEDVEGRTRGRRKFLVKWVGFEKLDWVMEDAFEARELEELMQEHKRRKRAPRGRLARSREPDKRPRVSGTL